MRNRGDAAASLLAALALSCLTGAAHAAEPPLDYARDVRPILAENCLACHGNDPENRQAELRLDRFAAEPDDAAVRGAEAVIVPGDPEASELLLRVLSDDADERMPPAASGKSLTPEQIETLRRWIAQGAEYTPHWAFVPPTRPAAPATKFGAWVRNPIDAFIAVRLEQAGLQPSAPIDRARLLRRLSLDLIGLPPTPQEVAQFVNDGGADAYERAVERLLASPHYGERWGRLWLDAARYADSDGFEKDKPRTVWMYRDWVINALNADMPYDQFIVEQVAGDMLPGATQDQHVATGFLRNAMTNEEGGIDPEQFRMEALFDRMDAIGKSMLGLTVQCAQCHAHKFDPITHVDYYRMLALLNNCDEAQIAVYTPEERSQWEATQALIRGIEERLRRQRPNWRQEMADWEKSVNVSGPPWEVMRPQLDGSGGQKHYLLEDGSVLAQGFAPTTHYTVFNVEVPAGRIAALRLEALTDPNLPRGGPGRSINGTFALSEFKAFAAPVDGSSEMVELKFASASADVEQPTRQLEPMFDDGSGKRRITGPIDLAIDRDETTAWGIDVGPERSNVRRKAVFVLDEPLVAETPVRITFHLVQQHGGWNSDDNQTNNLGRFRFSRTDANAVTADPLPAKVREALAVPAARRTAEQVDAMFAFWRTTVDDFAEANRQIDALWLSHPRGATQFTVRERSTPRATHRLERGSFLSPAEQVQPGVPSFLHALQDDVPPNRLLLARWLADRRSPTTARAAVNRSWQAFFGTGLVQTPDDLGSQGECPTHPELLDWLAMEFMDHDWSFKHLHRLIVTSATYQQASNVTPEVLEADPANRLLARGPRFRVDAEIVRDIALAASGLLSRNVGGPSVFPPAPAMLFEPPNSYGPKPWRQDLDADKYRRAMYTTRYRSVPYPALQNFDAPSGELSCVRRVRSNTPLQALTTLNEPLFVECARALALRMVTDGGSSDDDRLCFGWQACVGRKPDAGELAVLREFLDQQRTRFAAEEAQPWLLLSDAGQRRPALPAGVSAAELAAWTATARVLLNLDETISKE